MNLTVGSQVISLLDARFELNGSAPVLTNDDVAVEAFAKGGVFVQSNMGSSTVPITIAGETINAATATGITYGVYAGVGTKVAISDSSDLTMSLNTSVKTDGQISGSGKLQWMGQY